MGRRNARAQGRERPLDGMRRDFGGTKGSVGLAAQAKKNIDFRVSISPNPKARPAMRATDNDNDKK